MPSYEYQCERDGAFEVMRRLGTAPESVTCSKCGVEARRVFSAVAIKNGSRNALYSAMERSEKSRHEPDVVTSLPSRGATRRTPQIALTPTLRRLPRP